MKEKKLEQAANSPVVPGISPGRKGKTFHEEMLAFEAAYKVPQVIEVKDINAAAFVKTKGCSPTVRKKEGEIYFVFPDNKAIRIYLEIYKLKQSIALAESAAALRLLEAQVAAMRAKYKEKGGSVKKQ